MRDTIKTVRRRLCAPRPDVAARTFRLGAAALAAVKLALTAFQMGYAWVGGAPLDDELMFRAANAISAGQWLGGYDYLTLSKSMGFAVWLALLHALRLPYLPAGQLLWCGAALLAVQALAPVLTRRARLLVFGLLVFLPSSSARYTLRVYRDNIFPALCLVCLAGFAGAALRAAQGRTGKPARLWPWGLAAGLGLAAAWLTREDAGLFLLPFALTAAAVTAVLLARRRRMRALPVLALPFGILAAGIFTVCTINYTYYGLFALSDFSGGSFADAMGAMNRVKSEEGFTPLVTVPADVRERLYRAVPALQPLRRWLEEDAQLQNDFRDPALHDYRAGSFYWAIRRAAQFAGVYADAAAADAYWAGVAGQINALCDAGALPAQSGRRSGTTPPIRAGYIAPVLAESAKSLYWTLTFQDCAAYESQRSIGTAEDFAAWQGYLHCAFNGAAEAGRDTPYYSPLQKLAYAVFAALRLAYAAALPLAFAAAAVLQFARMGAAWRGGALQKTTWLLLFGLLLTAAYRCAMIAFMEVSSFGIGTSTMYLATVHPLLLLYAAAGLAAARTEFDGGSRRKGNTTQ